ncbi:4Fe-4S ferredoxin [Capsulimonas corticalis]|uniref:4Fe-4S ferredoxin n=1 Tax=Capsulimonas corticalis TaxID=2219043 RepID=A0A402CWV4_9BACT|nr:ferredoxin family protein [Capsulimonas corticalis]BDI34280.1 4Fe-4S ferredoxin [Capsulimonas corticalis]
MIELISQSRCIGCDRCVEVCPTNVFDSQYGEPPTIARQSDCQTCFLCEAYCPADAMFVAAETHGHVEVDEDELIAKGLLGSYRRNLGWSKGVTPQIRMNELLELQNKLGGRA